MISWTTSHAIYPYVNAMYALQTRHKGIPHLKNLAWYALSGVKFVFSTTNYPRNRPFCLGSVTKVKFCWQVLFIRWVNKTNLTNADAGVQIGVGAKLVLRKKNITLRCVTYYNVITRDAEPWHFWSAPAPAPAPGKLSGSDSGSGSE